MSTGMPTVPEQQQPQPPVQQGPHVPLIPPTPPVAPPPNGRRPTGGQWALIGVGVVVIVAIVVGIIAMAARPSTPTPTATQQPTQTSAPTATSQPAPKAAISEVTRSVSAVQNSAETEEISATATCPAGTTLVGGGYRLQPSSNTQLIFIRASYPSAANAWTVIESNPQSGGEVTLTASAICLAASAPVTVNIASATTPAAGAAGAATCPAGTTLTGGGFMQDRLGANVVDASAPTSAGSGWRVSTISEIPHSFTVYVLCASASARSALTPAAITTATTAIPNNSEGTATTSCKSGQTLIGGGYTFTKGGGYFLGKDVSVTDTRTAWAVQAYNLYTWTGAGPTPTPPPPLQVTAYAICVTSA